MALSAGHLVCAASCGSSSRWMCGLGGGGGRWLGERKGLVAHQLSLLMFFLPSQHSQLRMRWDLCVLSEGGASLAGKRRHSQPCPSVAAGRPSQPGCLPVARRDRRAAGARGLGALACVVVLQQRCKAALV